MVRVHSSIIPKLTEPAWNCSTNY